MRLPQERETNRLAVIKQMDKQRAKMPKSQRAKQFAPFDAVVGLRKALKEKEKIRLPRKEITEDIALEIDTVLRNLNTGDITTVVYYDDLEENYVQFTGEFEKLDIKKRTIKICNSLIIIDNISFIVKK